MKEKKMKKEENLKNTYHSFDEIITSPQPSPRGEGVVVGEVTNHTNTGEVTQKAACSSAFSRLENPFARTCHFLCFRSRKFLSSLTKFRSFAAHSYGFSLAETMIVLVIVAIIMGISAPLVVKKMKKDVFRPKVFITNGENIFTAAGRDQILRVGTSSKNPKLIVNGRTDIKGTMAVRYGDDETTFSYDKVNNIGKITRISYDDDGNVSASHTFTVTVNADGTTRTTNLTGFAPDYSHMTLITKANKDDVNDVKIHRASVDGYVYVNSLGAFDILPCNDNPTGVGNGNIDDSLDMNISKDAGPVLLYTSRTAAEGYRVQTYNRLTFVPIIVPVSEGTCFQCKTVESEIRAHDTSKPHLWLQNSDVWANMNNNSNCYFIPAKGTIDIPTDH